uniref:(northern house mosquito) hypothetical protein n=1 Tax=Culex pipiens TaxID=7175 RepID=A0A8D8HGT8_CULPI
MTQFLMRTFFSRPPNGKPRSSNSRPVLAAHPQPTRSRSSRTAAVRRRRIFRPVLCPRLRRRIFPSHRRIKGFDRVRRTLEAAAMRCDRGESRKIECSEWNGSKGMTFSCTTGKRLRTQKPPYLFLLERNINRNKQNRKKSKAK